MRSSSLREAALLGQSLALSALLLTGCQSAQKRKDYHAFTQYWPNAEGKAPLRLAVKDNIDVKGVITSAGSEYRFKHARPAKANAACLRYLPKSGVQIVGKTNLSEFAVAPSGISEYFGTPVNPFSGWWKLLPGGSSSGSAVAVATHEADVAFGTDTAGSVRVPAAFCGVVGLKTTYGRVPLQGVVPIEPKHLDTVGPLARDVATTAKGMALLEPGVTGQYQAERARHPNGRSITVGRLRLKGVDKRVSAAVDNALAAAGFRVVELSPEFAEQWEKAKADGNTVAAVGAWLSAGPYFNKPDISGRTKTAILVGQLQYPDKYREALARRPLWRATLRKVLQQVDFIALPTVDILPPHVPLNFRIGIVEALMLARQNTVAVNFAGNPAIAVPIPIEKAYVPVTSLQLVGREDSEGALLNAGRIVEQAVGPAPAAKGQLAQR